MDRDELIRLGELRDQARELDDAAAEDAISHAIGRRAKNKLLGRLLGRGGFWRRLWR